MSKNSLSSSLKYEAIYPEGESFSNVLVILHGYGANAHDFLQIAPFIKSVLKDTLIIIPNAPYICNDTGFKWFDLETFEPDYLTKEMEEHKHFLVDFIEYVKEKYQVASKDLSIFGFSQGAILALHYSLQAEEKFNAVVAHSGTFVYTPNYVVKTKQNVCLLSGKLDYIVHEDMVKQGYDALVLNEITTDFKMFDNLEHSVSAESLDYFLNFIKKSLT